MVKRWRKPLLPSDVLQRPQLTPVFHRTPSMHRVDNFQGLGAIPSVIQKHANPCIRPPVLPSKGTPDFSHCRPLPAPKFCPSRRSEPYSNRQVRAVNQSNMISDQLQTETASQQNPPHIFSPRCISSRFSTQQATHSRQRLIAYKLWDDLCSLVEHASPVLQALQQSMFAQSMKIRIIAT